MGAKLLNQPTDLSTLGLVYSQPNKNFYLTYSVQFSEEASKVPYLFPPKYSMTSVTK